MNRIDEYLADEFQEIDAKQFYRLVFPEGELDRAGERTKGKYTGIITRITKERKENGNIKVYRYTLTDELDAVDIATGCNDFCICRPLSYAGKEARAEMARYCYAIAVDVDKLRKTESGIPVGLHNLITAHIRRVERIPKPTAIVSSGTGIHLYYIFENPVALYRDAAEELQDLKRELTQVIWHDTIVDIKSPHEIQQEGIYQGFRMPGTVTKSGDRARVYLTGERVTVDYLNKFIPDVFRARKAAKQVRGKISRAEAKAKYPEWYRNRVENGKEPGAWAINRNLYEWWKREITEKATVGHRYYCLMTLAMYAQKCSLYSEKHNPNPVTREELEQDCFSLLQHMESLTTSDDNHFDEGDILDALESFDSRWTRYPRAAIEYKTGITIPANKRNGRNQETHLKISRATEEILYPGGEWRKGNGRRDKAVIVAEWRAEHPDGKKADCQRETGLSKPTVLKWWNERPAKPDDFAELLREITPKAEE